MNNEKKINIVGTATRYQMKKVIKNSEDEVIKSRKEIDKLDLPLDTFEWEQQHSIINEIYNNLKNNVSYIWKNINNEYNLFLVLIHKFSKFCIFF